MEIMTVTTSMRAFVKSRRVDIAVRWLKLDMTSRIPSTSGRVNLRNLDLIPGKVVLNMKNSIDGGYR